MKKQDLTGCRFGKLIALSKDQEHRRKWLCQCDCGNIISVLDYSLKSGHTQSCGCKKLKNNGLTRRITASNDRLYNIWQSMRKRCYSPSNKDYKNYGQRGITICDSWKDSYIEFYRWSLDNGYCDNLSIDRIDTNGNYSPDNCRWVSMKVQQRNRRNNVYIFHDGQTLALSEWCEILHFNYIKAKEKCRKLRKTGADISFENVFSIAL